MKYAEIAVFILLVQVGILLIPTSLYASDASPVRITVEYRGKKIRPDVYVPTGRMPLKEQRAPTTMRLKQGDLVIIKATKVGEAFELFFCYTYSGNEDQLHVVFEEHRILVNGQLYGFRTEGDVGKLVERTNGKPIRYIRLTDIVEPEFFSYICDEYGDSLQFLIIDHKLTEQHLSKIAACSSLKGISIRNANFSPSSYGQLEHLKQLELLRVGRHPDQPRDAEVLMRSISHMPNLVYLDLSYAQVTDQQLKYLEELKQLKYVNLDYTRVKGSGLQFLLNNTDDLRLEIAGGRSSLKKTPFSAIEDTANLYQLSYSGKYSRELMEFVCQQEELRALTLWRMTANKLIEVPESEKRLRCLRSLKDLRHLNVVGHGLTGRVFKEISTELDNLEILELDKNPLDDKYIKHITEFKKLKELSLRETYVTDASVQHLKKMTHLKRLDITKTQISEEGYKELESALNDTNILY